MGPRLTPALTFVLAVWGILAGAHPVVVPIAVLILGAAMGVFLGQRIAKVIGHHFEDRSQDTALPVRNALSVIGFLVAPPILLSWLNVHPDFEIKMASLSTHLVLATVIRIGALFAPQEWFDV